MELVVNGRFLSQKTTGVQRVAREFTRALDRLLAEGALPGVTVRLLVQRDAQLGDLALDTIAIEERGGATGHLWEQVVLPRHIGRGRLLNLGNTAPLLALLARRDVAVMLHDISYRAFPGAYRRRYRIAHRLLNVVLMRRADPIITVANTERAMLRRYYPQAGPRIVVAQNGGWRDIDGVAPRAAHRRGAYGLYVGSMSRRKNVEGVIAAAIALARRRGLPFKLVGAPSPILAEIALALPDDVKPLIEFRGQVEDAAVLGALYRDAAFLLFPSFYEASALPPLEAMAQGCPVIVSDIASLAERCGDAALYCDPADTAAMVAACERVLDEPGLADELVERGAARAACFTWRAQALHVVEALRAKVE